MELAPYQIDAVNQLRNGCILCGGVGSGKSRTSLAYYYKKNGADIRNKDAVMHNPRDLYIITTAQKRDKREWELEMVPFLLSTDPELNYYKNKVVVDSWNNIKKYVGVCNADFIFDEQRVVGYGEWAQSFIHIAKHNDWILLSATPGDKWEDYMAVFIANGFYTSKKDFSDQHLVFSPYVKFRKVLRYTNVRRLIRLREKILVDMDFNRKTTSHQVPVTVSYDISLYKNVVKNRWNFETGKPIKNVSELCALLRKVNNTDPSRGAAVLDIFKQHGRVIVFYNYDYELDILRNLPYGDNVEVAEWNGHMHQPVPDSPEWVYLVQYNAGAEGWNCITTNAIIFYSQNYSYRIMEQARGRIDRMNTPFMDLYYYHLKSTSSIDLAIDKALNSKKKFNEGKFVGSFW